MPPGSRGQNRHGEAARPGAAPTGPVGIGGWLILPAIGVALNPLIAVFLIVGWLSHLLSAECQGLLSVYPGAARLYLFELVLRSLWVPASIALAFQFFAKRPAAPKLFVALLIALLAARCIGFIWGLALFGSDYRPLIPTALLRTLGALAACAIWIPYFRRSLRVKNTFIR